MSTNERTGTERTGVLAVPELAAAGILMLLGGVGSVGMAVSPPNDAPISAAAWSATALLMAVLLAGAGVESLRRRHFPLVFLAPVAPALLTLGYVVHSGQTGLLSQILISIALMALVWSRRAAFS
jgi:hypothetical protein